MSPHSGKLKTLSFRRLSDKILFASELLIVNTDTYKI
jgi:hypothetical protein